MSTPAAGPRLLLAAGLYVMAAPALAEPRLLAGESGVFCRREEGRVAGVMCELVQELQSRLRYTAPIDIVPHARLKAVMRRPTSNTFFLPAIAGADYGPHVRAVVEMVRDEYVIVTSTRSGSPAAGPLAARDFARIGVLRGSNAQLEAERRGLLNLEPAASQETCAKKLDMGRIDGWLSTWNGARFSAKAAGIDAGTLTRGARFMDARLILMASADVPAAEILRWRQAYQAMRADGSVDRIYRRYDIQPASGAR